MATPQAGFTRASALGPIARFVDEQGGSMNRVMQCVDLPYSIFDTPDMLVPLREQFELLEGAARETGDTFFGARLGQHVRLAELSAFGQWVTSAQTLRESIARSNTGLNRFLQTATELRLESDGQRARWSIALLDPACKGRFQNELLGVCYLIDGIRTYAGRSWMPDLVRTTARRSAPIGQLEQIMNTSVAAEHHCMEVEFDARLLDVVAPGGTPAHASAADFPTQASEPVVPQEHDVVGAIAAVTTLAASQGYPRIEWVAGKLGMTRRSLQRRLHEEGTTFRHMVDRLLLARATNLLDSSQSSITDIALELGYTDTAHFSRAFMRWTGQSPSQYRSAR